MDPDKENLFMSRRFMRLHSTMMIRIYRGRTLYSYSIPPSNIRHRKTLTFHWQYLNTVSEPLNSLSFFLLNYVIPTYTFGSFTNFDQQRLEKPSYLNTKLPFYFVFLTYRVSFTINLYTQYIENTKILYTPIQ